MVSDQLPPGEVGQCLAPVPTPQVTALPAGTGCPGHHPLRAEKGTQGSNRHPSSRLSRGALSGGEGDSVCDLRPCGRAYFGRFHVTAERGARGPVHAGSQDAQTKFSGDQTVHEQCGVF